MISLLILESNHNTAIDKGLVLIISAKDLTWINNSEVVEKRELSCVISSRIGGIEALLFVLRIIEQNPQIESVKVGSTDAFFIASYLRNNFGIPYYLVGFSKLAPKYWNIVFNASGSDKNYPLLKNTYLPEDFFNSKNSESNLRSVVTTDFNVVIVAYYADPFVAVGSKRPEFINKYFNNLPNAVSTIVSAIPSNLDNHVYVPDYGFDVLIECEDANINTLIDSGVNVIGASWSKQLKIYFDRQFSVEEGLPNYIIFSGNPFYYFEVANYLKNVYGVKTILDYRDPFSQNPLMLRTAKTQQILKEMELSYNTSADYILVVNNECKDLVVGDRVCEKVIVMENGYDEDLYPTLQRGANETNLKTCLKFVYAGSFSKFRSGENFLNAIQNTEHSMVYMGSDSNYGAGKNKIKNMGMLSSVEAASNIACCDVGLVFATGEAFESTTKVYDYIGAELPILIVTNGKVQTGALHELTKDLGHVYWVENKLDKLSQFLSSFTTGRASRPNRQDYSRGYQVQRFYEQIYEKN